MKSFNLTLFMITFCLTALAFNIPYQQSYQKMIVGKWHPVLSYAEGIETNGKRTVINNSKFSSKDIMQFNADGSIMDSGQLYFSYSFGPDYKTLSLFDGSNSERKFEIIQLDKTTMKIVMKETDKYKGEPFYITWTIVFKRK
ncbi:hypothetical protein KYG33_03890 [Chryseobacterium sp. D764]|jgi:hypothetical protein|uniref:hypothetical protein n=1 Tax=unclassified Chryseobacterium TaxID=2593645 RepID=UPI0011158AFF|nr:MULTISPECIES: hypothetical protein [unclassified Chryseobacterium]QXU50191.1 hypothetical protein KYG33_03890 [Chryseobacterium sp. D764]CAD0218630.1 conserved exported protein of unknown function [Chryseobacterium sp. JV274]